MRMRITMRGGVVGYVRMRVWVRPTWTGDRVGWRGAQVRKRGLRLLSELAASGASGP
jgi:hypothetical protein